MLHILKVLLLLLKHARFDSWSPDVLVGRKIKTNAKTNFSQLFQRMIYFIDAPCFLNSIIA